VPSSYLDLILPLKNVAEFAKAALTSGAIWLNVVGHRC